MKASASRRSRLRLAERGLHWCLAPGLVLTIGIGEYGNSLSYAAGRDAAWTVTIYGLHKTIGLAMLYVVAAMAVSMSLWRRRPAPTGPVNWAPVLERVVMWALLVGAFVMPLSGPVLHGMGPGWGYAPIWWPFGNRVPGIPERVAASPVTRAFHLHSFWLFSGLAMTHVALACRLWLIRRQSAPKRLIRLRLGPVFYRLAPLAGAGLWIGLAIGTWMTG